MSEFDPTTNRIPFGLLSEDEQTALTHWPHDWDYYFRDEWRFIVTPSWENNIVYRGRLAPVVTSVWRNIYSDGSADRPISSREVADKVAGKLRITVLRIDTCNGVSKAHLEERL